MLRRVMRFLALIICCGLLVPLGASPAQAEPTELSAADRFGACVAGTGSGDLLFLMDQSSSLAPPDGSDPQAARVAAAKYLLDVLTESAVAGQLDLSVKIDGFDAEYRPGNDWTQLSMSTLRQLQRDADAFADRNQGWATDYWLALEGARKTLAARAEGTEQNCFAVLFFTDGALTVARSSSENDFYRVDRPYDPTNPLVTPQDKQRAAEAATESLCRAGGLSDQLRAMNVSLLGVGLSSAQTDDGTFDLMRKIVTGTSASGTCGAIQSPVPGDFTLVSDLDDLLFAFNKLRSLGRPSRDQELRVCVDAPCPEGTHAIVLDPSIGAIDVLAGVTAGKARLVVIAPDGRQIDTVGNDYGVTNPLGIPGVNATITWRTEKTASIRLQRDGTEGWAGPWRFVFLDDPTDPAEKFSRTSIQVTGDLKPVWPQAVAQARQDEELAVSVAVADANGTVVDAGALLGEVAVRAQLIGPDGTVSDLITGGKESLGVPVPISLAAVPMGAATMRISTAVTTAAWTSPEGEVVPGTALAAETVDLPLQILAPLGYPALPSHVNFGSAVGQPALDAELPIIGPGCVWLEPGSATVTAGPQEIGQVQVTSSASDQATCVQVAEGVSDVLALQLTAEEGGNGGLSGEITVLISPLEDPSKIQSVPVSYRANLTTPLNPVNFTIAFLAALLLGPGIPLGLMYLVKNLVAARIPGQPLLAQRITANVRNGQLLRDEAPFALKPGDLRNLVSIPRGGAKQVDADGIALRAVGGLSPFGAPDVRVQAAPGLLSASDATLRPRAGVARLPLAVHNHWVIVHDPSGPPDQAEVLLLISGTAAGSQRDQVIADLRTRAPGAFEHLRTLAPAGSGAAASDQGAPKQHPFGSGGGQAGQPASPFAGPSATAGSGYSPMPFNGAHGGTDSTNQSPFRGVFDDDPGSR